MMGSRIRFLQADSEKRYAELYEWSQICSGGLKKPGMMGTGDLCRGKQDTASRTSSGHRPGRLQLTSPQRWDCPTLGLTACHHMPEY